MGPDQGVAVTTTGLALGPNIAEDIKQLEEKVAKQVGGNLASRSVSLQDPVIYVHVGCISYDYTTARYECTTAFTQSPKLGSKVYRCST